MLSKFKMSAAALAVVFAHAPTVYAAHAKHKNLKDELSANNVVLLADAPRANFKWDPSAPILPTNQSQFLNWVEDINGGKSNEHVFKCWNNMICVSGLLDLDALYFDRKGNPFGLSGTSAGAGVRPLFGGITVNEFNGSINNANVFVDFLFTNYVRIHSNIDYVSSSVKLDSYSWAPESDTGDVYRGWAGIRADEIYAVFSDPVRYPAYLKVGKFYLDFGNYQPNGYGLPTIVPSLTQLLTQVRTGGAQLGFGLNNGLYGSATWSMAQQSMGAFNNSARNYSAKLGFMHQYTDMFMKYINASASFIWDLRDADYISGTLYYLNTYWVRTFDSSFSAIFDTKRQHAVSVNAETRFGSDAQFGLGVEGVTALGPMTYAATQSRVWAAGVNASYAFPTFGHDSSLTLGYQASRNSIYVQGSGTIAGAPFTGTGIGPFSYQLPQRRADVKYIFNVIPHVNAALEWVRDWDFQQPRGTNQYSDFGLFRIDLEF